MDGTAATEFSVTFPRVLRRLDYPDRLRELDYCQITVDGREMVQWYFDEMFDGRRYEQYVQSEQNRRNPDCLTDRDFGNAARVRARGWSYSGVATLINRH